MIGQALAVEGLCVEIASRHGTARIIDDVSFSIAPGEVLGMVGESGAGKSVTGTAILGLLQAPARRVAGRISLGGERIDTLDEAQMQPLRGRRIGAVFQDPLTSLNPLLTIGRQLVQVITTHLRLDAKQARAQAEQLLTEVGIPAPRERLGAYPHQLSGGMRQRVVLALAFACAPAVIIADEPTTALDVSVQAQVMAVLARMCRERGTAILLITHDMGVIAQSADRIAVLYAGRIVETGTADQVLAAPRHPYTAGLMASIPDIDRPVDTLAQIEGAMPRPGQLPGGCSFHPRCTWRVPRCLTERPDLIDGAACWVANDAA